MEQGQEKGMFWFVRGNVLVLMVCRLIWSFSTSIIYPFFSLYIEALGGTSTEIGLVNALGILSGMILFPVGGYIADRSGRVKLIGYITFLYAGANIFFIAATSWKMVAIGQFLSHLLLFYSPALNAIQADSLPPNVRGKGFAMMMAVPGAVRILAPVVGGYFIESFRSSGRMGETEALIYAMRVCWGIATLTGFLVAWIRLRYLKETVPEENPKSFSYMDIPRMIIPAYRSIFESIRWMNRSLKVIVVIEMFTSFFIAMSAPFYVVYAKHIIGITEGQWGNIMFIAGLAGILLAFKLGDLTDRIGSKKMILIGMALAPAIVWSYQYMNGFIGVTAVIVGLSICNNIMMPAFSTIIANTIPRERRGRLYSLLGERGITVSFGNFWGGGFLLFPPAALGAYTGGWLYKFNPNYPWMITSVALVIGLVMIFLFVHEPEKIEE